MIYRLVERSNTERRGGVCRAVCFAAQCGARGGPDRHARPANNECWDVGLEGGHACVGAKSRVTAAVQIGSVRVLQPAAPSPHHGRNKKPCAPTCSDTCVMLRGHRWQPGAEGGGGGLGIPDRGAWETSAAGKNFYN